MRNMPVNAPASAARDSSRTLSATSIEAGVRRRQNLQILGTFAGLAALVALLNCTPLPLMVCEQFGLDRDVPASLLGESYWGDCFGGPLGDFVAGPLPRPGSLSYAPEADAFLAALNEFADAEAAKEAASEDETEAEVPENGSDSAPQEATE